MTIRVGSRRLRGLVLPRGCCGPPPCLGSAKDVCLVVSPPILLRLSTCGPSFFKAIILPVAAKVQPNDTVGGCPDNQHTRITGWIRTNPVGFQVSSDQNHLVEIASEGLQQRIRPFDVSRFNLQLSVAPEVSMTQSLLSEA